VSSNADEPAFPQTGGYLGMTKRELGAFLICAGICGAPESQQGPPEQIARAAVTLMDLLFAELEKS
jgi:hypothetical protein